MAAPPGTRNAPAGDRGASNEPAGRLIQREDSEGLGERQAARTIRNGAAPKLHFAPVPARAFGDEKLTKLHLRVLGVIAMHDRMSGNRNKGQGCLAGNVRLAAMCGCNLTNLSTALTELSEYIEREPHPLNKKLRVYRVLYNDEDEAFIKRARAENALPVGKSSASPDDLPTGKRSSSNALPHGKRSAEDALPESGTIVCPTEKKEMQDQGDEPLQYIPRSGEDIPPKRERDLAEARGSRIWSTESIGAELAKCERHLKAGLSAQHLDRMRCRLEEITVQAELGTPDHQRASQLLEDVLDQLMHAA